MNTASVLRLKKKTLRLKGSDTLRNHISFLHEDLFHSLGQESSWQPCKRLGIVPCIFSDGTLT